MPNEFIAVECTKCKKLTLKTKEYLLATRYAFKIVPAEDSNEWRKEQAPIIDAEDQAFCNVNCLSDYLMQHLS